MKKIFSLLMIFCAINLVTFSFGASTLMGDSNARTMSGVKYLRLGQGDSEYYTTGNSTHTSFTLMDVEQDYNDDGAPLDGYGRASIVPYGGGSSLCSAEKWISADNGSVSCSADKKSVANAKLYRKAYYSTATSSHWDYCVGSSSYAIASKYIY